MIVETPQILWNPEDDSNKGLPAALMSMSLCESGIVYGCTSTNQAHVLATAGNTNIINLWKIVFLDATAGSNISSGGTNASSSCSSTIVSNTVAAVTGSALIANGLSSTKVEHLCSLGRHDTPVNAVRFSPDGLHLASGGANGAMIIWSVPVSKRANGNGRHYWSIVSSENDLHVKIVTNCGDGISDLAWSADSKRILLGTIDHATVCVEDDSYDANHSTQSSSLPLNGGTLARQQKPSEWRVVYNKSEHTHYVQGVAYDPLGVYLASMSSDRTVRIVQRKPRIPKKILYAPTSSTNPSIETAASGEDALLLQRQLAAKEAAMTVQEILTSSKIDTAPKSKQIKYRKTVSSDGTAISRQLLYTDESTLESFFRRLAWTVDGAFLITPAALWQDNAIEEKKSIVQFATLVFARHRFEEPYRVLTGLEKPSIAVRPNPVLFELPLLQNPEVNDKENESPSQKNDSNRQTIPYRSIFAVLTWDSVVIYDTFHTQPLSIILGIHYAHIVDATWSSDGHSLMVCSTDGYISIIRFTPGELGLVYTKPSIHTPVQQGTPGTSFSNPTAVSPEQNQRSTSTPQSSSLSTGYHDQQQSTKLLLPPCEPGPANVVEGPPEKKAKIAVQQVVTTQESLDANKQCTKRPAPSSTDAPTDAVDKLSLNSNGNTDGSSINKKLKKRIQPTLVAVAVSTNQS